MPAPIYTGRMLSDPNYRRGFADAVETVLRHLSRPLHVDAAMDICAFDTWAKQAAPQHLLPPDLTIRPITCRHCTSAPELCQAHADECPHCESNKRPESCYVCSSKYGELGGGK